jgi:multidrug efflux pump subunit AcrA (membrane-fusion protein)
VQRSPEGGGKIVMVIASDGTAHRKNIILGIQTTESAQITSGLTPSDTVITAGSFGLDDGSKVKVEAAKDEKDDKAGADDEKSDKPGAGKEKPAAGEKE